MHLQNRIYQSIILSFNFHHWFSSIVFIKLIISHLIASSYFRRPLRSWRGQWRRSIFHNFMCFLVKRKWKRKWWMKRSKVLEMLWKSWWIELLQDLNKKRNFCINYYVFFHHRALLFVDMILNFSLQKPWDEKSEWPLPAAEVYYMIGMAYTELVNHSSALEAFNNSLKINPEYSQVTALV